VDLLLREGREERGGEEGRRGGRQEKKGRGDDGPIEMMSPSEPKSEIRH